MNRKLNMVILIIVPIVFGAACSSNNAPQSELPTIMSSATPSITHTPQFSTPDINLNSETTPVMDVADVIATSEAISVPIQSGLASVAGLETVLSVTSTAVDTGINVFIEAVIPAESDNEATMDSILEVVQGQAAAVTQIQVRTWAGEVLQKTWTWQNGSWASQ